MKKISDIYKKLGVDFTFPIEIDNANGNPTYYEDSNGYWEKYEYDAKGNRTHYENSEGDWYKYEYDSNGNLTYYESSTGYWRKHEHDANGNVTYYEGGNVEKRGTPTSQSCTGKIVEVDGKKNKLTEL